MEDTLLDYAMAIAHERELEVLGHPHDTEGAIRRFNAACKRGGEPVAWLSCDPKTGKPVWSEDCVCEDNVYSPDETGTVGRPVIFADDPFAAQAQSDPRTPADTSVNGGALKLALNVLRRAGKNEIADELEKTATQAQQTESGAGGLPDSPTRGMNLGQRIAHVGGRENAQGYVEFGSPMAVDALIQHVLRDVTTSTQAGAFQARYRIPGGPWSSWGAVTCGVEGHEQELRYLATEAQPQPSGIASDEPDWLQRLRLEARVLSDNLDRLSRFRDTAGFRMLTVTDQGLLDRQGNQMHALLQTLNQRIHSGAGQHRRSKRHD